MLAVLFVLLLVIVCLIIMAAPAKNWPVLLISGLAFVITAILAVRSLT